MAEQIFADGPIDAPAKYVVPGSSEIIPVAVQALLDGSNASGDFVPTLIFRSQAGHVIARVPTSTTVVAGGSAEVSWFPGVKSGGGGVSKASLAQSFVSQGTQGLHVIPSGVATTIPMDLYTQAQGFNPGVFVTTGLPSGQLTFAGPGAVVSTLMVSWPAGTYDRYIEITVANPLLPEYVKSPRVRTGATPDGDLLTVTAMLLGGAGSPATTITATAFQASGINRSVSAVWFNQATSGHIFLS